LVNEIRGFLVSLKKNDPSAGANCESLKSTLLPSEQKYYIESESGADSNLNTVGQKAFKAVVHFEDGCQMENVRAFAIIHNLKELVTDICFWPEDIIENNSTEEIIRKEGFSINFRADCPIDTIREKLMEASFLDSLELKEIKEEEQEFASVNKREIRLDDIGLMDYKTAEKVNEIQTQSKTLSQSIISVSLSRLDTLMDLVGEMVIAEAMVIQNPDLRGLELDNFEKAARQLHKITFEMQDVVMSIRMVSLSASFHRMQRIVRDMCHRLNKKVRLSIVGEETEVDKNIIDQISDPLMHLVRNAIDHGIGSPKERIAAGKDEVGTITLEAKNAGNDVLIIVKDDGKGLSKAEILKRAREKGLIDKEGVELNDKEVYQLIFAPGFSTKTDVSEFSGRGVGMDVVSKNIEKVGGSVLIDSERGKGTSITFKIPLTLSIIDGMNVRVGKSYYTIPTISIRESFRPKKDDVITDPNGNEMILVRGHSYPILRLHRRFGIKDGIEEFAEGILVMIEEGDMAICLFVDELVGQQQVVVKALPSYVKVAKKGSGLAGCTLLGDGSISLILDVGGLMDNIQTTGNWN
jgi:two-component system chemotaxis sensor kinase CheA